MAGDSNTGTPASGVQSGSEFANPVGVDDEAIWSKHFSEDKPKGSSGKTTTRESSKASDSKATSGSKKTSDDDKPKASKPSAERTKDSPKSTSESDGEKSSKPKASKSTEKDDESGATGWKTADKDKEPADPEEPSKKARDLFQQAKKTEDRREARKLYKRAMVEAFGEVPEEFDDKRYAAVRTERAAAKAALDAQASKNEGRIREAADKLKPAIFVMRQLEGAGIADKLTVPMVERAVHVMRALRSLEDGDFTQLAEVVARAAGVDHDEAMKRFVRGTKVSPEGKAARQAAEQAQREAAETRAQLAQLRKQLEERDTTQTAASKKAETERKQQDARAGYLDDIQTELDGHPVLKLRRGAERVLSYLIKTRDPVLKTPRFSYAQVADKIVRSERRRAQEVAGLDGEAVATTPPARRLAAVSRSETVDDGVPIESGEAAFERIFHKHRPAAGGRR